MATKDKDTERTAAVAGAQAVADAVKKVTDAVVSEVQKTPAAVLEGDFSVTGVPGGSFEIRSHGTANFGASGTVKFGTLDAKTTEWGTTRIVGTLPPGVAKGEVTVLVDDKTQFTGELK